ncbi:MAG: hypothetical protein IJG47_04915 [Microbacterium sp.]|nr:hypothetical protein [Microbacterium sp.]
MDELLPRSSQALEVCQRHAAEVASRTSVGAWAQVESALASYAAATIYAEAESIIKTLTADRLGRSPADARVRSFGKVAANRLIRSIKIGELSGVLGHFGHECKEHFSNALDSKDKTDWDSLIGARHGTAHFEDENASPLTLGDVAGYFPSVGAVLETYRKSLET